MEKLHSTRAEEVARLAQIINALRKNAKDYTRPIKEAIKEYEKTIKLLLETPEDPFNPNVDVDGKDEMPLY